MAAAIDVRRCLGLPAGEPEILAAQSNVLVRPGSVVERVLRWPGQMRLPGWHGRGTLEIADPRVARRFR